MPTFQQEALDFFDFLRYPENNEIRKQCVEQRRNALRCLLTFTMGTNYPYYVVTDEKIAERTEDICTWLTEEEKLIQRAEGDSFGGFLAGPGIILTGCDHAVALSTGQKFKGAKGPGIIFTDMSDHPKHIIDLRVQLRAFPVEARTKDGIAIKVFTFTPFQIDTGNEKPELGKGFPYRSSAVFKAVHAQLVEHVDSSQMPENLKQHEWYDLPQLAGERIVREIISRYEFDELYAPFELHTDPGQDPRSKIGQELGKELEKVLPDWGLQRIGSGISNLMPVDERVIEQRIEAWQADWARKIMLKQATGQSRRIRLVEQARAQAQIDIILAIGKRIEQLRATGDPVPLDAILLYFVEVLEDLAGKAALRRLLPGDTGNIIQLARGVIGPIR
ncbi:MAG: SPFH domain-containing protein [Chloroflexota bacterium]|nr:SPFH domain-containing protein [Chloroflexota bacterium]